MKSSSNHPSNSSGLKEMSAIITDAIKTLTAPESDSGLNSRQVVVGARKRRSDDFSHRGKRINSLLLGGKEKQFQEIKLFGNQFRENADRIMGWVKDPQACTIGVWGMAGVGKTALMSHVHNELLKDCTLSQSIYWMNASKCDNVYKWQESIAKCFGLDLLEEEDEMIRARKIFGSLAKLYNIVLILDDIWQPFTADEVGIPLENKGWKILLATPSFDVCRKMRCKSFSIKVETLSDNEAQDLFENKHQDYGTLTEGVKTIAKSIVKFCEGLPRAIITMAHCMTGYVDFDEWKNTLDRLHNGEEDNMKDKVFSKLQLSYDRLHDETVQSCFLSTMLYLAEYWEEYWVYGWLNVSMNKSMLINLWIHEGLLDRIEDKENQIREGHAILSKLVNSCLLEYSSTENVGVSKHSLLHNMTSYYIHKNYPRFWVGDLFSLEKVLEDELWSGNLVKVKLCCHLVEKTQCDMSPECLKVKVLVLRGNHLNKVVRDSFFLHMNALRILDLSHTMIIRLSESVSNLTNLRVLLLCYCEYLKYMPSLAKLMKLKVLDLFYSFEIKKTPKGIESLKCLEELKYNWNISDLTNFNKVIRRWNFSSQLCYHFVLHDGPHEQYEQSNLFTKEMTIIGVKLDDEKDHPILLPHDLEKLRIIDCNMIEMKSLELLALFSDVQNLELRYFKGIEYILSTTQQVHSRFSPLRTLEDLIIFSSTDLKAIIKIEGSKNDQAPQIALPGFTFSHLKLLTIQSCSRIKNIFLLIRVPTSLDFPKLEEVTIESCLSLEEICESIDEDGNSDRYCDVSLPNLKSLWLSNLPMLGSVFRQLFLYTSLRKITISFCNKIKEVFPQQPLFPNLEIMEVSKCKSLEVIFDSSNNCTNSILVLPTLRTLKLKNLPKLGSIYRGILLCTCLEEIEIEGCPSYRRMEQLSKQVICDKSASTLNSIPTFDNNEGYWEPLRNYPKDKDLISSILANVEDQSGVGISRNDAPTNSNVVEAGFQQSSSIPSHNDAGNQTLLHSDSNIEYGVRFPDSPWLV